MATIKECNCMENAIRSMALATEMKDSSFFHIQTGVDHQFKQLYSGPEKIRFPKGSKSLVELIDKDANILNKELKELEISCKLVNDKYYIEGKNDLLETIKSQGRNLTSAYIAGTKITDIINDLVSRKKLFSCQD